MCPGSAGGSHRASLAPPPHRPCPASRLLVLAFASIARRERLGPPSQGPECCAIHGISTAWVLRRECGRYVPRLKTIYRPEQGTVPPKPSNVYGRLRGRALRRRDIRTRGGPRSCPVPVPVRCADCATTRTETSRRESFRRIHRKGGDKPSWSSPRVRPSPTTDLTRPSGRCRTMALSAFAGLMSGATASKPRAPTFRRRLCPPGLVTGDGALRVPDVSSGESASD